MAYCEADTSDKADFYKDSIILLEGAIIAVTSRIDIIRKYMVVKGDRDPIEYYTSRIKSVESMKDKLRRKNLPETLESVFHEIYDAVGIRIICTYIDDVYRIAELLGKQEDFEIIRTKDYIQNPKPSGYRSYHMIVRLPIHVADRVEHVYAEIQLRTISMDFWAALEHQLRYKHEIPNQKLISAELKRCADELASTEMNFQTIRDMINESLENSTEDNK